jgi:hypothetical protein
MKSFSNQSSVRSVLLGSLSIVLLFCCFSTCFSAPVAISTSKQSLLRYRNKHTASFLAEVALNVSETNRNFISTWASAHLPGPPLIENEEQLLAIGQFISPVLHGGLGNIMLQIASVYRYARKYKVTFVVAWWDQSDTSLSLPYRPFEGRGDPATGITLKHIFPSLNYASFEPAYRGVTKKERCRCDRSSNLIIKFVPSKM